MGSTISIVEPPAVCAVFALSAFFILSPSCRCFLLGRQETVITGVCTRRLIVLYPIYCPCAAILVAVFALASRSMLRLLLSGARSFILLA
ncbi:hypothetical protein BJ912DRAFT_89685 [Pholiota molesta]|nr:hypothetical protein BJ912DRAFT_89685 [Pholiota molesta]